MKTGRPIGFVKVMRDVTECKKAVEALEHANAALCQSQKMELRGQLTGRSLTTSATDVVMPESMDGIQFARSTCGLFTDIRIPDIPFPTLRRSTAILALLRFTTNCTGWRSSSERLA